MEVETDFLAEEWFTFLKEKVEPHFPDTEFYIYAPPVRPGLQGVASNAHKIGVRIDDKAIFKTRLKGYPIVVTKKTVEESLQNYVYSTTKKFMNPR